MDYKLNMDQHLMCEERTVYGMSFIDKYTSSSIYRSRKEDGLRQFGLSTEHAQYVNDYTFSIHTSNSNLDKT